MVRIDIAHDFTPFPFGRYRRDGEFSGEAFREDRLVPLLSKDDSEEVEVILDGVMGGLGSSFLEEVFGGLVRVHHFQQEALRRRIKIVCKEDPALVEKTWSYVADASAQNK